MNHLPRCDAAPATVKSLLITTGYTKPGQRIQRLLTAKLQATLKPKSAKQPREITKKQYLHGKLL